MNENEISKEVIGIAIRIHTELGPGLFESVYEAILASELERKGLDVVRQQIVPVIFEGTRYEMGFRADLVVAQKVIVEVKSIESVTAVHRKQLLTYLRLADMRLGLLVNFNVTLLRDGLTRIVNGLDEHPRG